MANIPKYHSESPFMLSSKLPGTFGTNHNENSESDFHEGSDEDGSAEDRFYNDQEDYGLTVSEGQEEEEEEEEEEEPDTNSDSNSDSGHPSATRKNTTGHSRSGKTRSRYHDYETESRPSSMSDYESNSISDDADETDDDEYARYPEYSRIGDENPSLMRYLEEIESNSSSETPNNEHGYSDLEFDENEVDNYGDAAEDSSIEKEEEDHILHNTQVDTPATDKNSDDDFDGFMFGDTIESDSEHSDENDYLDIFQPSNNRRPRFYAIESPEHHSDEEGLIWEYFFTSDGDEDEGSEYGERSGNEGSHRPDGKYDTNDHNRSVSFGSDKHSGDSTDEDTNLPPAKHQPGQRAFEVLGSNSFSTRPPILGQWQIDNSQGTIGIIDGLTTRTLSPPLRPRRKSFSRSEGGEHPKIYSKNLHSDSEQDISDVALDEFINTEQFDDENDEGQDYAVENDSFSQPHTISPYIYRQRFERQAPAASAFKRGQGFDQRRRRRSSILSRDSIVSLSPVRSIRKKSRRKARRELQPESRDLIEELIDANAISPLFDI